jgi:zinc protease
MSRARFVVAACGAIALVECAPAAPVGRPQTPVVVLATPPAPSAAPRAAETPEDPFRLEPPHVDPIRPLLLPPPVRRELANGIPVVLVPFPSIECAVAIIAKGGFGDIVPTTRDAVERVNEMLNAMDLGIARTTKGDPEQRLARAGMTYPTWHSSRDGVAFLATVPAEHFALGFEILTDLIVAPSFEASAFERMREQDARRFDDVLQDGARSAEVALGAALFGSHPYGRVVSAKAMRAVSLADVQALYARVFQPSRLTIIVVGNVPEADVLSAFDEGLGKMPRGGSKPPSPISTPPPSPGPRIVVVDQPGTDTAFVDIGYQGPKAGSPDLVGAEAALAIAMTGVFGRGKRLRDELSLGRWLSGFIWSWQSGGEIGIRMRTSTANVPALLRETDAIVSTFAAEGPTPQELDAARSRYTANMIYRFETPSRTADAYRDNAFAGVGDGAFASAMAKAMDMTAEDLRAVSAKYFDRSRLHVAVVGNLAALREPLGELGWGAVEVRDADGNVVPSGAARTNTH